MSNRIWWIMAVVAVLAVIGACTNSPPPAKPPTGVSFSDDSFTVGGGAVVKGGHFIPPGDYVTKGVGGDRCTWSKWLTPSETFVDAGFVTGTTVVTTRVGERFEVRGGCTWTTAIRSAG